MDWKKSHSDATSELKEKSMGQDLSANLLAADEKSDEAAKAIAVVSWTAERKEHRKYLSEGRHLLGTSAFAAIRIDSFGNHICGIVEVRGREVRLKCTGATPTIFVDGHKLAVGKQVLIGDILELTVGRLPITITANSISQTPDHMKAPEKSGATGVKKSRTNLSIQDEADAAFASPDDLRQLLSRKLLDQLDLSQIGLSQIDSPRVRESARLKLKKILSSLQLPENFAFTADQIEEQVFHEVMGLGPLEPLLADEAVTEIMVNRRDQIFVEKYGNLTLAEVNFSSDQALLNVIERIVSTVGRRIDTSSPVVDARLLDGSRVNAIIPPLALKGPCLTIRRFSKTPITVDKLIGYGSLDQTMADFLKVVVHEYKNIIISGGTGSGKTTLLNALSSFIPSDERIVTVEDAAELQLLQEHVVSLETRPPNLEGVGAVTIRDLVKNTLRMRPDRIIVGECRGGEALDMLQAMNTGHDGSMTTAHANTPGDMLRRLETMVMMAGMELPLKAIREQIASALTVIVQQTRRKTGARYITDIAWVNGIDSKTGEYNVFSLYKRNRKEVVECNEENLKKFWETEEIGFALENLKEDKPC